jgi:putative inorganic carbon (HCO3(-)) transporter
MSRARQKIDRVSRFEQLLAFCFLVTPLVISSTFANTYVIPKAVFVYLLAASWLLYTVFHVDAQPESSRALAFLFCVFVGISAFSALLSPAPLVSLMGLPDRQQGLLILLAYGIMYAVSARVATDHTLRRVTLAIGAVTLIECAYCVLQAKGTSLFTYYSGIPERLFGTTGNPIFLGAYLSLVIPVLTAGALSELRERRVVLFALLGAAVVSSAYFLVESGSRGAFLGCVVGIVSLTYLLSTSTRGTSVPPRALRAPWLAGALAALLIAAVLLIFVLVSGPTNPLMRIVSTLQGKEPSALNRLEIARSSLRMVADRPLTGYGVEQMFFFFPSYQSTESVKIEGNQSTADRAHNEYLQLAIDSGMPGFLAGVALLIYILLRSVRAATRGGWLERGAFGSLLAYATQAFFGITHLAVFPVFLVLAGQLTNPNGSPAGRAQRTRRLTSASRVLRLLAAVGIVGVCLVVGTADVYARRAKIADNEGDYAGAAALYEKAAYLNRSAMPYAFDGGNEILIRLVPDPRADQRSLLERAIALADAHLAANPRSFTVLALRASAYYKLYRQTQEPGFLSRAFDDAARAQAIAPFYPNPYYIMISIYDESGDTSTALSLCRRLVAIDSASPEAFFLLAQILTRSGHYEEALAAKKKAEEIQANR